MSDIFMVSADNAEFFYAKLYNKRSGAANYAKVTRSAPQIKGYLSIVESDGDVTYVSLNEIVKISVSDDDAQYLAQALGGSKWAY